MHGISCKLVFSSWCTTGAARGDDGGCRFEVKHVSGMGGRSPPRGGAAVDAANQQLLVDSEEEPADDTQAGANPEADISQRASKRRKVCRNYQRETMQVALTSALQMHHTANFKELQCFLNSNSICP